MIASIVIYAAVALIPSVPFAFNACRQKIEDKIVKVGTKTAKEL